jgi:hypothetical protein
MLLDRSGSMETIRDATIAAFNGFLLEQSTLPGEATLLLVQFADGYQAGPPVGVREAPRLERETLEPGGFTALLDAMGRAINETAAFVASLPAGDRTRVLFVILTDGQENASKTWSRAQVFARVNEQQERGWQFMYLGANQDAFAEAAKLGVRPGGTARFDASPEGVRRAMNTISIGSESFRLTGTARVDVPRRGDDGDGDGDGGNPGT